MPFRSMYIVLFVALVGASVVRATTPEGWSTYNGSTYSIRYPESWTVKGTGDKVALLASLPDSSIAFNANVNVLVDTLPGTMTWKAYVSQNRTQILPHTVGNTMHSLTDTVLNGHPATVWSYTFTYKEQQLTVKQYLVLSGRQAYILTYTNTPQAFETMVNVGTQVMTSITFN